MLDLNPELVDQDHIRKLRRKRLLKIAFLPTLILILIGVFFLRTTFFNIVYSLSFENQNYNTAKFLADEQKAGNIIAPYVAYFDTGTINLKREQFKEAEESFRETLRNNPPKEIHRTKHLKGLIILPFDFLHCCCGVPKLTHHLFPLCRYIPLFYSIFLWMTE